MFGQEIALTYVFFVPSQRWLAFGYPNWFPFRADFQVSPPSTGYRLTPRCHATILSLSTRVMKGSSQSSSSSVTAGSPRSSIPPYSQRLKVSGSLARKALMSCSSRTSDHQATSRFRTPNHSGEKDRQRRPHNCRSGMAGIPGPNGLHRP